MFENLGALSRIAVQLVRKGGLELPLATLCPRNPQLEGPR